MQNHLFTILDSIESTNNYAMAKAHEGLATHGQAWFANEQWGGKGQRGKQWITEKGQNIILSIAIKPDMVFTTQPFYLNAFVALVCRQFFANYVIGITKIKWPNDIFYGDNKAGGILIENIYSGKTWKWAIIGIGININQVHFAEVHNSPTSLKNITHKNNDVIALAKELHQNLIDGYSSIVNNGIENLMVNYNQHVYKLGEMVFLKKENAVFETSIMQVNNNGQLITNDVMERTFKFGEVEWIFK